MCDLNCRIMYEHKNNNITKYCKVFDIAGIPVKRRLKTPEQYCFHSKLNVNICDIHTCSRWTKRECGMLLYKYCLANALIRKIADLEISV